MRLCDKIRYTKKGILAVRESIYKKRDVNLRIYKCPICHTWHLTSIKKPYSGVFFRDNDEY
jgi:hypothetical protein